MSENQDNKTTPLKQLHEKKEYAKSELADDFPVVALSSSEGIYIVTSAKAVNHDKVDLLVNADGVNIVFAGRGNQTDLSILKTALEHWVSQFIIQVSTFDLAGQLVSSSAAEILRNHFLNRAKALSVQVIIADPMAPDYPFWATNFDGATILGKNFTLSEAGIQEIKRNFGSMEEMRAFAHEFLKKYKGTRQFYQLKFKTKPRSKKDSANSKKTTR